MQHRRRFQGGLITPEEFHAKYAFPPDARCLVCPSRPLAVIRVLVPVDELRKRDPVFDVMCDNDPVGMQNMFVQLTHGPHVLTTSAFVCKQHLPEAEKAIARSSPSWAVVEINRGPGVDNPKVGGGTTLPT